MTSDDEPIRIIDDLTPPDKRLGPPWRVLVVDDSQSILDLSDMVLAGLVFDRRQVSLFFATSAKEAQRVLAEHGHDTFAVALIDVVMEDETAGLRLVEYIRTTLHNREMRLILRTGQPGLAPEENVIQRYDINDYRNKTDLRAQQLITLMITALRGYRDLVALRQERERAQRLAVEAESASRAKSAFLAVLCHELRTPLDGILGNAELLQSEVSPAGERCLADLHTSAQRMASVVEDLLDMALLQTGTWPARRGMIELPPLLQRVVGQLQAEADEQGVILTCEVDDRLPQRLLGDPLSLARVLHLVGDNAVKFSVKSPVILRAEQVGLAGDQVRVRLSVSDRGPGLPPDRERLLQAFVLGDTTLRRRHGGLGLGLSIAKGIVDHLQGSLLLSDRDGGGAVVAVELALLIAKD